MCDDQLAGALDGETGNWHGPEIAARDPWGRHRNPGQIEAGVS